MPTRLANPFASTTSSNASAIDAPSEKGALRRPPSAKSSNKFTQFFSISPKAKSTEAAFQQPQALGPLQPNASSLSLPSICLHTATGEKSKMEERPQLLFQPPSPEEARRTARQHAQFGPLSSKSHLYSSRFEGGEFPDPVHDEPPYYILITTYISYLILIIFGHVRDYFGKRFRKDHYRHLQERNGYAPLNSDFDNFYVRRLQQRICDCFQRPTTGVPGRFITLLDRSSDDGNLTFKFKGTQTETLNMSSYNYLGFAQSEGPCADAVELTTRKYGFTVASPRGDSGTSDLALEVEDLVARFVGKPAAMVFSMGFVTNAAAFPALVGKGCLILSDELNHSSIRFGARLSGAMIEMFKHNDMKDLERVLREVISQGQPRTHRPWKKILVAVEGLYSMEGTMCNLPGLVALKQRYKFHLYVDEAHSIGALGPRGRGVCDYFDIDPAEVDVLMGTLTKSFGANGGYLAADRAIIDKLRLSNAGTLFAESPSPPVLSQILSALRIINGELVPGQGEERLQRLAFNSRYLRLGLKRLGFIVPGHDDSPIIPLAVYNPAKISAFSHEMLRRKISVVVVGYPATPLVSSRARFCVSAAHTKDDLDRLLAACDRVGDILQLKFSSGIAGGAPPLPDGVTPEMEREMLSRRLGRVAGGPAGKKLAAAAGGAAAALPLVPPRWRLEEVLRRGADDVKVPLR